MEKYDTVDEYLANFSAEVRRKLDIIRKMIREEIPKAEEKISYGIPAATLEGRYVIYFAGYKNHVSIYPRPSNADEAFAKKLKPFVAGKGTLRFPVGKDLPEELIRKVVRAKLSDFQARKSK